MFPTCNYRHHCSDNPGTCALFSEVSRDSKACLCGSLWCCIILTGCCPTLGLPWNVAKGAECKNKLPSRERQLCQLAQRESPCGTKRQDQYHGPGKPNSFPPGVFMALLRAVYFILLSFLYLSLSKIILCTNSLFHDLGINVIIAKIMLTLFCAVSQHLRTVPGTA